MVHADILQIDVHTKLRLYFENDTVHFKHAKTLKLNWNFAKPLEARIPLTFDALEEFSFLTTNVMADTLFDFVENNPSLKKLSLRSAFSHFEFLRLDDMKKRKFATASQFVKEIQFARQPFAVCNAIFFMDECKSLQKLTFQLMSKRHVNELRECMKNEWKISKCEYNYVTVERQNSLNAMKIISN